MSLLKSFDFVSAIAIVLARLDHSVDASFNLPYTRLYKNRTNVLGIDKTNSREIRKRLDR